MDVEVKIKHLDKLLWKVKELGKLDPEPILIEAVRRVQDDAKKLAPVKTGYLKGSILTSVDKTGSGEKTEWVGRVFTNTEYAKYQEFGYTRKVKKGEKIMVYGKWRRASKAYTVVYSGKPFLLPALKKNSERINKDIQNYLKAKVIGIAK